MKTVTAYGGTVYQLSFERPPTPAEQRLIDIMEEAYQRLNPWGRFRASVYLAWAVLKLDLAEWWKAEA